MSQMSEMESEAGFTKDEFRDEVRELFVQPVMENLDEEIPSPGLKKMTKFGKQNTIIGLVPQMLKGGQPPSDTTNPAADYDLIQTKRVSKKLSNIAERILEENAKVSPIKKSNTKYYNSAMNFSGLLRGKTIGMHGHGGIELKIAPLKKYSGVS